MSTTLQPEKQFCSIPYDAYTTTGVGGGDGIYGAVNFPALEYGGTCQCWFVSIKWERERKVGAISCIIALAILRFSSTIIWFTSYIRSKNFRHRFHFLLNILLLLCELSSDINPCIFISWIPVMVQIKYLPSHLLHEYDKK